MEPAGTGLLDEPESEHVVGGGQRNPELGVARETPETFRGDPDDSEASPVERDVTLRRAPIPREPASPKLVGQDRHLVTP